jgi:hypothetical protein
MKKQGTVLITLILAVTFGAISCQSNTTERSMDSPMDVAEADPNLSNAKNEYVADMENFKEETSIKISANEQSVKEFKASIASNEKDPKVDNKINDLEVKNADMKRKLDEYKMEGKDQWNTFKKEFSADMEEIERALDDLTVDNK